jgi:hypothetical protein
MAKVIKKSVAPIYAVGVLWLVWGLFFPLYRPMHYVLAVLASAAVYFLGKMIWPDRAYETASAQAAQPQQEKTQAPESTGDAELDALLAERDKAVSEMRRLNDSIQDPTISQQIDHLESTTKKIIAQVVQNPKKLPQIRKFMSYFLPTTLKLLNAYDRMDTAGISGTNIDGTKDKVQAMMGTIVAAFDKQLDALFGDEALDISTDITVMEQMLNQEGLGSDMRYEI